MFKPTKRPVPSPAALRVLTQLAYISSGTALGVATLCAEERRRRIKIVQRIADNAKVIRAHPRYHSSAALAARDEWDETVGGGGVGKEEGVKSAALPSVVDMGYERVTGPSRRERTRRWRISKGRPDSPSSIAGSDGAEQGLTHSMERKSPPHATSIFTYAPFASRSEAMVERLVIPSSTTSSMPAPERRMQSTTTGNLSTQPYQQHQSIRKYKRNRRDVLVALHEDNIPSVHEDTVLTYDFDHWATTITESSEQGDVTRAVDYFFANHAHIPAGRAPSPRQVILARQYLGHALTHKSFEDIRSLLLWKLHTKCLTAQDVLCIVHRDNLLASRLDEPKVLEFYLEVFDTQAYRSLDAKTRLMSQLFFLADLSLHYHEYNKTEVVASLRIPDPQELTQEDYGQCVESAIRTFLAEGHTSSAVRLFSVITYRLMILFPAWLRHGDSSWRSVQASSDIRTALIDACLNDRHMTLAARLFRLKSVQFAATSQQVADFIQLCGTQNLSYLLADVFAGKSKSEVLNRLVDALNDSTKEVLAVACSKASRHRVLFDRIYDSLSTSSRETVRESATVAAIKSDWRKTRNLAMVELDTSQMRKWLVDVDDQITVRKLDEAIVEIYLSAGRLDSALEVLSRLSGTENIDSRLVSLTALVLARNGGWSDLARLQAYMVKSATFTCDYDTTALWDKVINLYASSHTPAETWTLVRDLVGKFGFAPTTATANIVLQTCIEKRQIDIIPEWLRYLNDVGCKFVLDARVAAEMYTWFWLQTRARHKRIMWHCYFLQTTIPSFGVRFFKRLIMNAITYDLRDPYEQDLSTQNPIAHVKARLHLVESATGRLPKPGWSATTGDRELYFTRGKNEKSAAPPPSDSEGLTSAEEANGFQQDAFQKNRVVLQARPNEFLLEQMQLSHLTLAENSKALDEGERVHGPKEPKRSNRSLEGDILVAMSTGRPQQALDIYELSLDAHGLPASPRILDMAVEACIRLHGDDSVEAERTLTRAKEAGMNVTVAAASLIMRHMRRMDRMATRDANDLRMMVLDYYKLNDENGWCVSHHVATSAADRLINQNHAEHAVNLLSEVHKSKWATQESLDIVTMTVFLKGYRRLQSLDGVRWVVQHVLKNRLQVSRRFMRELKAAGRHHDADRRSAIRKKWTKAQLVELADMAQQCYARRLDQIRDDFYLGVKLEWTIKRCVHEQGQEVKIDYDAAVRSLGRAGVHTREVDLDWLRPATEQASDDGRKEQTHAASRVEKPDGLQDARETSMEGCRPLPVIQCASDSSEDRADTALNAETGTRKNERETSKRRRTSFLELTSDLKSSDVGQNQHLTSESEFRPFFGP